MASVSRNSSISDLARVLSAQTGMPLEDAQAKILQLAARLRDEAKRSAYGAGPRETRLPPGAPVPLPPRGRAHGSPGDSADLKRIVDGLADDAASRLARPATLRDAEPQAKGPSLAEAARMLSERTGMPLEDAQVQVSEAAARARKAARRS